LLHIIYRDPRRFVIFMQEKIGQRGLSSLNLRGDDRFFANVEVEQEGRVGEKKREGIETPQGSVGLLKEVQVNVQGRARRQSKGDKSLEAF
jgi:hypothetical protein